MTTRDTIRAALQGIRIFVHDCLTNSHDRACIGNLMSARDECDNALTALDAMDWQPAPEAFFDRPIRGDIVRSTLLWNYVYLQGANGDVWRVWIDIPDMQPCIELVAHNQPLPSPPMQEKPPHKDGRDG